MTKTGVNTSDLIVIVVLILQTVNSIAAAWIGFKMAQLERNTNSKMDAFIALTAKSSLAQGVAQERLDHDAR